MNTAHEEAALVHAKKYGGIVGWSFMQETLAICSEGWSLAPDDDSRMLLSRIMVGWHSTEAVLGLIGQWSRAVKEYYINNN